MYIGSTAHRDTQYDRIYKDNCAWRIGYRAPRLGRVAKVVGKVGYIFLRLLATCISAGGCEVLFCL